MNVVALLLSKKLYSRVKNQIIMQIVEIEAPSSNQLLHFIPEK